MKYFKLLLFFSFCFIFFISISDAKSNSKNKDFILTNSGQTIKFKNLKYLKKEKDIPLVYFTKDITAESILNIYKKLDFKPAGKVV